MIRALLVGADTGELTGEFAQELGVEVIACAHDAAEASTAIQQLKPDRVLLPRGTSAAFALELLGLMAGWPRHAPVPEFVFLPDDAACAPPRSAFGASGSMRLGELIPTLQRLHPAATPPIHCRVACFSDAGIKLVPVEAVETAHSDGEHSRVVGTFGELKTRLSLRELELKGLWRCHKQFLVNPEAIDQLRDGPAPLLITRGGHEVPVGRRFMPRILGMMGL